MMKRRKPGRSSNSKRQSAMGAAKRIAKATKTPQVPAPAMLVRRSKKASIVALLQRPQGAAIDELTAATGWQTHSIRAALTGLRKEGNELARIKNEGGVTHYRLAATA